MASTTDRRRPRRKEFVGGHTTSSGRDVSELKPPPPGPGPGGKRPESPRDKK